MTTDISIDIECASTERNAAITQIGIAIMRNGEIDHTNGLDLPIDVQDYARFYPQFDVDIRTMVWWGSQSQEAKDAAFGTLTELNTGITERLPLIVALSALCAAIQNIKGKKRIWAKPPSFDLVIIQNALKELTLNCPWHFREERCLRTLLSFTPKDAAIHGMPIEGDKHNAYDDALHQLRQIRACLVALGRIQ